MAFNKKTLKWIFIVVAIIIVAAILYFIFRKPAVEDPNKSNTPVPAGSPTIQWVPESFPLNIGMYGPKIKALQSILGVSADGKLGPITKSAIVASGYTLPLSQADYNTLLSSNYIGKSVYAIIDGVQVLNSNNTVYKVGKKDEYMGTITGVSGEQYLLSGNRKVYKNLVYVK